MGGNNKTTQTQTTNQTTKTNPWERTIPTLDKVTGLIDSQTGNTAPTGNELGALDTLTANAQAGNPYAPQIGSFASDLLGNGERTGMVRDAYSGLQAGLSPYTTMESDPYKNEAFTKATGFMSDDIMDRIKSQYAGAGYSPVGVGDFGKTVGEGIARGVAPTWLQAYNDLENRKLGAVQGLYNAGNQTASALTDMGARGIGASTAAQQAKDSGAERLLSIESMRRGLPLQNIAQLQDLIVPMAQLGGTSNMQGTTTGTTESETPLWQQLVGAGVGGLGALSKTGAFGPTGWMLSSGAGAGASGAAGAAGAAGASGLLNGLPALLALSDVRAKEDISEIGTLHDGSPVYSFKYIGDPKTHVGLMAQDVEQRRPDAVVEVNGLKMVDYGKATEAAGILGRLGK